MESEIIWKQENLSPPGVIGENIIFHEIFGLEGVAIFAAKKGQDIKELSSKSRSQITIIKVTQSIVRRWQLGVTNDQKSF